MSYTSRSRDRYKALVAATTGLAALASALAAGTATGLVARTEAEKTQAEAQRQAVADGQARAAWARSRQATIPARTVVLTRERPQRTVIHTRVVRVVSGSGVAVPAPGGTVTQPAATPRRAAARPATPATAAPVAPAPAAPPPAPSSAS